MDINELKLVLETVAAVSGDAKAVAIWYFAAKYGFALLNGLVIGGAIYAVVQIIAKTIASSDEWGKFGRSAAKAWGGEGDTYSYNRDAKYLNAIIKAAPEKK